MKIGEKWSFRTKKNLLFSGILLSGFGGYPPLPLTENHPSKKTLAEMGVPPPPERKVYYAFPEENFLKRTKSDAFVLNQVKN